MEPASHEYHTTLPRLVFFTGSLFSFCFHHAGISLFIDAYFFLRRVRFFDCFHHFHFSIYCLILHLLEPARILFHIPLTRLSLPSRHTIVIYQFSGLSTIIYIRQLLFGIIISLRNYWALPSERLPATPHLLAGSALAWAASPRRFHALSIFARSFSHFKAAFLSMPLFSLLLQPLLDILQTKQNWAVSLWLSRSQHHMLWRRSDTLIFDALMIDWYFADASPLIFKIPLTIDRCDFYFLRSFHSAPSPPF